MPTIKKLTEIIRAFPGQENVTEEEVIEKMKEISGIKEASSGLRVVATTCKTCMNQGVRILACGGLIHSIDEKTGKTYCGKEVKR